MTSQKPNGFGTTKHKVVPSPNRAAWSSSLKLPILAASLQGWRQWRPSLRTETLALLASLYFSLACNSLFWSAVLAGRSLSNIHTWFLVIAVFISISAAQFSLLCLVLNRWTAKPLLSVLIIATAFAVYYMNSFTVFLDPSMLRNVLHTDVEEAKELFTFAMLPHLFFYAVLPLAFLWRVQIKKSNNPSKILHTNLSA